MEYLRFFNEHSEYEDFTQTDEFIKPNAPHYVEWTTLNGCPFFLFILISNDIENN